LQALPACRLVIGKPDGDSGDYNVMHQYKKSVDTHVGPVVNSDHR